MKPSFFERLSGSVTPADSFNSFDSFDEELPIATTAPASSAARKDVRDRINQLSSHTGTSREDASGNGEGQLPVDVHQTASDIVIRAFVAGVRPDELNISINRDMVEISGSRMEREQISTPDYFTRELFWGSFARNILLPQEIDVESSSASAKDGLLTIIMPKLDKARQTKLRVKAG